MRFRSLPQQTLENAWTSSRWSLGRDLALLQSVGTDDMVLCVLPGPLARQSYTVALARNCWQEEASW